MKVSYFFLVNYEDLDEDTYSDFLKFRDVFEECIFDISEAFSKKMHVDDILSILDKNIKIRHMFEEKLFDVIDEDDFYKQTFLRIAENYRGMSTFRRNMAIEMFNQRVRSRPAFQKYKNFRRNTYGNIFNLLSTYDPTKPLDVMVEGRSGVVVWVSTELIWLCHLAKTLNLIRTDVFVQPDIEGFELCENLEDLQISTDDNKIPPTIFECKTISTLRMGAHHAKKLPKAIGNLTNLTTLRVEMAKITKIPETIGNLAMLSNLHLAYMPNVANLPEFIGNLTKLTKLYLDMHKITHLPDIFCNFEKLETLELISCASLVEIPDSIGCCENLKTLDIMYCYSLSQFPSSMIHLHNLQRLVLNRIDYENIADKELRKLVYNRNYGIGKYPNMSNFIRRFKDHLRKHHQPLVKSAYKK